MGMSETATGGDRSFFRDALMAATVPLGVAPEAGQEALMWAHFEQMVETNRKFNLTRITTPADAAVKHYADSLSLLAVPGIDRGRALNVLDVGTGAGFPAVPLAIVCPAWHITAIDGTGKKARFVAEAGETLGLRNLVVRHARGDEFARMAGARFDLVLLRAVTKISPGLVEVQALVRRAGAIVFYKTAAMDADEMTAGRKQAAVLKLVMRDPVDIDLPSADGPIHRRFIVCERPG